MHKRRISEEAKVAAEAREKGNDKVLRAIDESKNSYRMVP